MQRGFIQIPILALIFLGTLAVSGGGYYFSKHSETTQYTAEPTVMIEHGEQGATNTTSVDAVYEKSPQKTSSGFAPLESLYGNTKQPVAKHVPKPPVSAGAPSPDNLITPTQNEKDGDFAERITNAETLLKLLEQDKGTFQFLRKTTDEHQQKAIKHAGEMMGAWVDFADSSITSVPSEYQRSVRLTKESIESDREYVLLTIKSYYAFMDLYFANSSGESNADVIHASQERIRKCVTLWSTQEDERECGFVLDFVPARRDGYARDFKKITEKLVEIDHLVLETISSHARDAEEDIGDDLERISRMVGTLNSVQTSLNAISQQAQQGQTQYQSASVPVRCFTTTNDPILAPNRTYYTTCEPDTRTAKQLCDAQISAWLGGGAVTPKPACE